MFSLIFSILILWLIAKFVPYGDKIVAVLLCLLLLKLFGLLPIVIL